MFNIVLVNPAIHTNTGSIGRMCVNANCALHLIRPLGFIIDDKHLRRAGLDYWEHLRLKIWDSWEQFLMANQKQQERFFYATTKVDTPYFQVNYQLNDFLIFGSETHGLDEQILNANIDKCVNIPMCDTGRSLNLATSVGIITYEAIRQNFTNFNHRTQKGKLQC